MTLFRIPAATRVAVRPSWPRLASLRPRCGLTLVELLATVAIIGLLVGLLLPAVQSARESSRRTTCSNNLKQIALGILSYETTNGALPPSDSIRLPANCGGDCRGAPFWVLILPHIEQAAMAAAYDPYMAVPMGHTAFVVGQPQLAATPMPIYVCPSSPWTAYPQRRDYFGVAGGKNRVTVNTYGDKFTDGIFAINRSLRMGAIRDGTGVTFLCGESIHPEMYGLGPGYGVVGVGGPDQWPMGGCCTSNNCDPVNQDYRRGVRTTAFALNARVPLQVSTVDMVPFASSHPGQGPFAFADGHVQFIDETIGLDIYQSLSTFRSNDGPTAIP